MDDFSIASACTDDQPPDSLALIVDDGRGWRRFTFADLAKLSNAAAADLCARGGQAGDRVAIMLPQGAEFAIALLGAMKAALIPVPVSTQFGRDGLAYRLGDSGAVFLLTDAAGAETFEGISDRLAHQVTLVIVDGLGNWGSTPRSGSARVSRSADGPAVLLYTSGSTGKAKGVLHAHRALRGQAPGLRLALGSAPLRWLFWTPSDWSWVVLAVLGVWLQGRPVLAAPRRGFDPDWAWSVLARNRVRLTFLTPTAMRLLRQATPDPGADLRVVLTGGEPIGEDLHAWSYEVLKASLAGTYGQTEADLLVGDSTGRSPVAPGAMGRAYPGHDLAVFDSAGRRASPGTAGELVLKVPDPALMLGYWHQPEATAHRVHDGWMWTGDEVIADERGYLWFQHRTDDIIKSAGYRIGPGEIEECLLGHAAVADAAVIGAPDPVRGQVVKALVVLAPGALASAELEQELRARVKVRLASYQYPRVIEFVAELPLTTTGKVNRAALRQRETEGRAPTLP